MKRRLTVLSLAFAIALPAAAAAPGCQFEPRPAAGRKLGQWIDQSNWLSVENQRLSLQSAHVFMPSLQLVAQGDAAPLRPALRPLAIDSIVAVDPLDGSKRDLAFLLDSRLDADGLLVLHNGRVLAERYRNGLQADQPRLLMQATRPLLNMLGGISINQGKLAADRSVTRYIPALSSQTGIRKLSVQRLLEGEERHAWSAEELENWRLASGWHTAQAAPGVRSWLSEPGRWEKPLIDSPAPTLSASPSDDLLVWALAESNATPLARLFCEQLLSGSRPEHPVSWLTDPQGVELADGLALSLRDFGRLGQQLLDARGNRSRSKIPGWFVETLTASSGLRRPDIKGLPKGSEQRYGFTHLGGQANRVALIGTHGTSLYIDFDQRLVIALYATYPKPGTPALMATLEAFWKAVGQAQQQPRKR
jgi:CubicO group peptidase (beta-lactamase class C family)